MRQPDPMIAAGPRARPSLAGALHTTVAIAAICTVSCARPVRPPALPTLPAVPIPRSPMQNLVPLPASVEIGGGDPFTITPDTVIVVAPGDDRTMSVAKSLAALLATATTPAPEIRAGSEPLPSNSIQLATGTGDHGAEGYELTITTDRVTLLASEPAGLFYGVQTLRQLLPYALEYDAARLRAITLATGRIVDRPRFAWRGAMLDVSRHFFDVADVERYIDLLALHKLNRLHLHLSDDQGWRIEIASWPNLTAHGGSTQAGGGAGGFYTQAQYAGLVAYAQERFVTLVPEIDVPGHTNAALASYAELNCDGVAPPLYTGIEVGFSTLCVDKEVTYRFIDDVVREIAAVTPGAYFHIGGDEVKKLAPAQYARFIERVQTIVRSHGKQMIGWDETAAAGLHPTSIVQHWRPETSPREAVDRGVKVILSPADRIYLDMKYDRDTVLGQDWAGHIDVRHAYGWNPGRTLEGVPESAVLGVEAPLWSETVSRLRDVEFLAFPRLAVVAELGWSTTAGDWDEFAPRLGAQAPRWSALGINFHRSPQVPWQP